MVQTVFVGQTDAEIWAAFQRGDAEAYSYMYDHHFRVLYNYGRHLTKHEMLVEDCIQELFLHLLTHRSTLTQVRSIKYYLFKALRRRIHQALLRDAKWTLMDDWTAQNDFAISLSSEQLLITDQTERARQTALQKSLAKLPKRQREALFLIFYQNLTYKEAAEVMTLEVKTVYNLIYNALVLLKKHLGKSVF